MNFANFSVNSTTIYMKFYTHYFLMIQQIYLNSSWSSLGVSWDHLRWNVILRLIELMGFEKGDNFTTCYKDFQTTHTIVQCNSQVVAASPDNIACKLSLFGWELPEELAKTLSTVNVILTVLHCRAKMAYLLTCGFAEWCKWVNMVKDKSVSDRYTDTAHWSTNRIKKLTCLAP